jgi:prepilin-type N-terminal cleavage/methylation domain-containing protein/prepilin-type processing-associated H-X9-DG protein
MNRRKRGSYTQKQSNLATLAARHSGYFTIKQAREAGYKGNAHYSRVQSGQWLHEDGIYRLPGFPDNLDSEFAKWSLWSRNQNDQIQAVISHQSALIYHKLIRNYHDNYQAYYHDKICLTVPRSFRKKIPEEMTVYKSDLEKIDFTDMGAFRVTTPLQTLRDLAAAGVDHDFSCIIKDGITSGSLSAEEIASHDELRWYLDSSRFEKNEKHAAGELEHQDSHKSSDGLSCAHEAMGSNARESGKAGSCETPRDIEAALEEIKEKLSQVEKKTYQGFAQMEERMRETLRPPTGISMSRYPEKHVPDAGAVFYPAGEDNGKKEPGGLIAASPSRNGLENLLEEKRTGQAVSSITADFAIAGGRSMEHAKKQDDDEVFMIRRERASRRGMVGSRAGFTLVELLVVVAILSILASMLMPVLSRAMNTARKISCINNQKQLFLAVNAYASDYAGLMNWGLYYPSTFHPYEQFLYSYVGIDKILTDWRGTVFRCSSPNIHYAPSFNPSHVNAPSYSYNAKVLRRYSVPSWYTDPAVQSRLSSFRTPSKDWTFMDGWCDHLSGSWCQGVRFDYHMDPENANIRVNWDAHDASANAVFLDGHAASYAKAQTLFY